MDETKGKTKVIQIRLTELEKSVIKDKAELLGLSLTDYIKECCIFNNATLIFMQQLHKTID